MNNNETQNFDFANLSKEQLTVLKTFEDEFNQKNNSQFYIMAFDKK